MPDDWDLVSMHVTEPVLGMQLGPKPLRVHGQEACAGRSIPCCIHNPSAHHMLEWPMNWRADTKVMERLCPHGTGHPDPDHLAYVMSLTPEHECPDQYSCAYPHLEWQSSHGCPCGCCRGLA